MHKTKQTKRQLPSLISLTINTKQKNPNKNASPTPTTGDIYRINKNITKYHKKKYY